ncbi:MAG TPA: hypothetical protein EYO91_05165 [Gemmatimonadetes bacterium]|jgi:DNA uptake protein ComE-like DNA-binding protein|nr:hypothetical protein [Gemmatimonadota bacterium]|tara:strand:- start:15496 stop:16134 length:639 start_codon:yes stop_codon:yes gene_type:complete
MGVAYRILMPLFLGLLLLAAPSVAQVGENLGLINPNLASADELATVPALNRAAVEEILAGRPFLSMLAFHEIVEEHVSESAYDRVYGALWIPIDLNDVTNEEILLIPGVGNRMLHEFEEYRPYIALLQFHREIGKYVDDEELARLAQYVYVRIDLNSASQEEILSIPGVGPRMQHEFEEYRPYTAMAQFSREIGKYVDDEEVNRLARYVEIR